MCEKYVSDNTSVCREERQYTLYLSNILRYYSTESRRNAVPGVQKIFNACAIPPDAAIEDVFIEASFMRDYFERNRRSHLAKDVEKAILQIRFTPKGKNYKVDNIEQSFNYKLLEYVKENDIGLKNAFENRKILEINYGHNEPPQLNSPLTDDERVHLSGMMNCKPDLAVIYTIGDKRKLLLIECKFKSPESKSNGYSQTELQWFVADFFCKYHLLGQMELADCMLPKGNDESGHSLLVKFARQKSRDKYNSNTILIENLLSEELKIFKQA